MKVLIVGATGTIGSAVSQNIRERHSVICAGKTTGDIQVDITCQSSIKKLFDSCGNIDAIISATGNLHFGPLVDMTADDFNVGLQDKLLGQVNLVLIGQHYLNESGSITLSSGIVSRYPVIGGTNATTVNAAIEGFVVAASIELRDNKRINAVCPSVLTESISTYGPVFPGYETVSANRVAKAYQRSLEGALTGRVFKVW